MVHLIGSKQATCTQRVLTVLAEKGVTDWTMYEPDFMAGEHKKPPHTDKQPFGEIPVLEDDGFRLFESRAICHYIASKYADQGTKLLPDPTDLKASATFNQWFSVELDDWNAYAYPIVVQKFFNKYKGLEPIQAIIDDATTKFNAKLDIFDKILGTQKYMAGDEFSLVDIYYLPYTQKLFETGDGAFITSRANVNAWWQRVSTRDSWRKVYKNE